MQTRKLDRACAPKFLALGCVVILLAAPAASARQQQQRWIFGDTLPPPAPESAAKPAPARAPQAGAKQKDEAASRRGDEAEGKEADKGDDEEDDILVPNRPGVAGPAEFQRPGILQADFGYDGSFRSPDGGTSQSLSMDLRLALSRRLLVEFDLDNMVSETDEEGARVTGVGNSRLGFQWVFVHEAEGRPAQAFAYFITLPTASESKGLGTGRYDQKFIWLVGETGGKTETTFNAAYLLQGREEGGGWEQGGQGSLSLWRTLNDRYGVQGEISGQSVDEALPRGLYALGAVTYKVNRRLVLDAGLRFGLTRRAPRFGLFGGAAFVVADVFGRRR